MRFHQPESRRSRQRPGGAAASRIARAAESCIAGVEGRCPHESSRAHQADVLQLAPQSPHQRCPGVLRHGIVTLEIGLGHRSTTSLVLALAAPADNELRTRTLAGDSRKHELEWKQQGAEDGTGTLAPTAGSDHHAPRIPQHPRLRVDRVVHQDEHGQTDDRLEAGVVQSTVDLRQGPAHLVSPANRRTMEEVVREQQVAARSDELADVPDRANEARIIDDVEQHIERRQGRTGGPCRVGELGDVVTP